VPNSIPLAAGAGAPAFPMSADPVRNASVPAVFRRATGAA
jgi:hypothetical protein